MRLDPLIERGDVGVDPIDAVQHPGQQEPVMITEVPVERLLEPGDLGAHAAAAICAKTLGSRSPAINASIIARPDTPKMSEATTDSLIQASSSSFSTRCFSRRAVSHQIDPVAGQVAQPPDRRGRHETGPQHAAARRAWHSHTASSLSSPN